MDHICLYTQTNNFSFIGDTTEDDRMDYNDAVREYFSRKPFSPSYLSFSEPREVHSNSLYDMPLDKRMEKRGARGHLRFVGKRAHHRGHLRFVGKRDPRGHLRFAKRAAMGHLRFVKRKLPKRLKLTNSTNAFFKDE